MVRHHVKKKSCSSCKNSQTGQDEWLSNNRDYLLRQLVSIIGIISSDQWYLSTIDYWLQPPQPPIFDTEPIKQLHSMQVSQFSQSMMGKKILMDKQLLIMHFSKTRALFLQLNLNCKTQFCKNSNTIPHPHLPVQKKKCLKLEDT